VDIPLARKARFGVLEDGTRAYAYPDAYQRQTFSQGVERLAIGAADAHVSLLSDLAGCLPEPFKILYVLVVPRIDDVAAARYEAPGELSRQALQEFLGEFSEFFECDGRHHVWIANPDHGTIVYDRHNVIYAYGPLDDYASVLATRGLREGPVDIPAPHWHAYHADYDAMLRRLLDRWRWVEKPLGPRDHE
jgi:hypothetical protein